MSKTTNEQILKIAARRGLLALMLLLIASPGISADPGTDGEHDWNQWRGPGRDAQVSGDSWPENLDGLTRAWRVSLGKGYPGPIVAGQRVFVVETVDSRTAAARALDRETGEVIWTHSWASKGNVPFFANANGDWVRSTPAFDGKALFVGDMSEVLVAIDVKTGKERWRVDFPGRYGTGVPDFGFASSPLLAGEALFVQAANSIIKIDTATGETIWRALEGSDRIQASGAFSSPILATVSGRRQLVVLTRQTLYGLDPAKGEVLWTHEVPNFRGMNILTPVIHGDSIVTSPYKNQTFRYDIVEREGALVAEQAWVNKASGYMSSPVIVGDHVYLHLGNGRLDCIDLRSGESRWRSEAFGKYWSMVVQGDKILALDDAGQLYLIKANPERFELLDTKTVADAPTWAHLAVSGEDVLVRDLEAVSLYRWSAGRSTSDSPSESEPSTASISTSATKSQAPRAKASTLIEFAISRGVPLFNGGQAAACAAVYQTAAQGLVELGGEALTDHEVSRLRQAMQQMEATRDPKDQAWVMRHALDDVYASLKRQEVMALLDR